MSVAIGQTRSLTQQFLKYRADAKRSRVPDQLAERAAAEAADDRATAKLLGAALGASEADIEMGRIGAGSAPRWVQGSERIKGEMLVLKDRIKKLQEYHGKALLVTFGEGAAAEGTSRVDALTREVQLAFKRLDGEIRALGQPAPGGAHQRGAAAGEDDEAVRLQVQRQLAQALLRLSVEFRKQETRFLNKMEAQRGLERGSVMGLVEEEGASAAAGLQLPEPGLTQEQLMKVSQAEVLIEERDIEIKKVVDTIVQLAEVMRDLSTLVVEQGTLLDRIDHNIVEAAVKVEEGVKELVKAEQTQRSGRAMYCIVLLCVLIAVFLIATIVRHA